MTERDPRIGLLRILVAAAWADGELSSPERETIRRIERDLGLVETAGASLEEMMENPLGLEEAERMAAELVPSLDEPERKEWLQRIDQVIRADREVDPRERRLLERLRSALRDAESGPSLLSRIRGIFRGDREEEVRPEVSESGIVGKILERIPKGGRQSGRESRRFEYATLFGALLYRVAFSDGVLSAEEEARLRTLLTGTFGFDDEESQHIVDVIESKAAEDLDRQRLCANFNRVTDMDGRMRLLGCLFIVSEADGEVSEGEIREMRLIANYLWIGAREFHQVRSRFETGGGEHGA